MYITENKNKNKKNQLCIYQKVWRFLLDIIVRSTSPV